MLPTMRDSNVTQLVRPAPEGEGQFLDALDRFARGDGSLVLHTIAGGAASLPEIRTATDSTIAETSLISILRQLMQCGAVTRSVHSGPPLLVRYHITEAGLALDAIVLATQAWTENCPLQRYAQQRLTQQGG